MLSSQDDDDDDDLLISDDEEEDEEEEPVDDREGMLALKAHLPPQFTNTWVEGIREINLQADNWYGVLSRKNAVMKLSLTAWGVEATLAELTRHLETMECLESLHLDENPASLTGSLKDLSSLTRLRTLSLSRSSRITGSLASLSPLKELRALFIERTRITGNLDDLADAKHLMVLAAGDTAIAGNLTAITKFPDLRWLLMSRTRVSGNLTSLKQCIKLERLQLADCSSINGPVQNLARLPSIQGIGLANTGVSGELMHLGGLRTLHGLRLDGTAVLPVAAGDIDSFRAVTGCDIVIVPEQNKQRR